MARTRTSWVKGQSGNPKGAPRRHKSLTEILEVAGSRTIEFDGKRIAGKRFAAQKVWEGILHGVVTLPDRVIEIDSKEWLDLVKWAYGHMDPPSQKHQVTGAEGEALIVEFREREPDEG